MKSNFQALLAASLALIGVGGEAYILRHDLVWTYPYKMLSYPPDSFYRMCGNIGCAVVVALCAVPVFLFYRRRSILSPMLVTAFAPQLASLLLLLVTITRFGWQMPAAQHNFDGYTIQQATLEFFRGSIALSIYGFVVGGACSLVLRLFMPRSKMTSPAR